MQNLFEFPNTILYNSPKKSAIPQCSLKRNFTEYAKRHQKIANYIRRNPPYSLWWHIFNSPVLPKNQTQMDFPELQNFYLANNYASKQRSVKRKFDSKALALHSFVGALYTPLYKLKSSKFCTFAKKSK